MSNAVLRVDTDALENAGRNMRAVHDAFVNAGDDADAVRSTIPHSGLQGAITEFAQNWQHHRRRLVKRMDDVAQSAEATAREFKSQDRALARALGQPQASGGSAGQHRQTAV